ncbi:MAG: chemotaxis protein, partial [Rhizobiales bacterium]|nr:chemotaxis protein [Hyphomicrobiales bacterium]
AGEELLTRLTRIVSLGRPAAEPTPTPDAHAVAAAAQAFAERTRARMSGLAA